MGGGGLTNEILYLNIWGTRVFKAAIGCRLINAVPCMGFGMVCVDMPEIVLAPLPELQLLPSRDPTGTKPGMLEPELGGGETVGFFGLASWYNRGGRLGRT